MTYEKPRLADPRIRAAIEGPFIGLICDEAVDAAVLDYECQRVGAFSVLYRERAVALSTCGEPVEEVRAFIRRAVVNGVLGKPPKEIGPFDRYNDAIEALFHEMKLMYDPTTGRIVKRPEGPEEVPSL